MRKHFSIDFSILKKIKFICSDDEYPNLNNLDIKVTGDIHNGSEFVFYLMRDKN